MATHRPELGHLQIEVVERKPPFIARYWFWRTRSIDTLKVGVRSGTFPSVAACEASIKAHRHYLGTCPVYRIDEEGRRSELRDWAR